MMFKQAYIIGKVLDGEIPDVYIQSEKYWEKHKDKIREFYSVNIPPPNNKVALHIRRGDYLKAEHFHTNLLKTDYYQQAIKLFPNAEFLVFCKDNQSAEQDKQDRIWVADFMDSLKVNWEFAPLENSEVDDMNLMASCKALIGANSSFSWWAAWLSQRMAVFPKQWFVDGIQRIEMLDSWIKI